MNIINPSKTQTWGWRSFHPIRRVHSLVSRDLVAEFVFVDEDIMRELQRRLLREMTLDLDQKFNKTRGEK